MQHTCSLGADFPQPNQRAQLAEIEIPNLLQFRNLVSLQLDCIVINLGFIFQPTVHLLGWEKSDKFVQPPQTSSIGTIFISPYFTISSSLCMFAYYYYCYYTTTSTVCLALY